MACDFNLKYFYALAFNFFLFAKVCRQPPLGGYFIDKEGIKHKPLEEQNKIKSFIIVIKETVFVSSYDLLEEVAIVVDRHQHLLCNAHAKLFLLKILQFWNNLRYRTFRA